METRLMETNINADEADGLELMDGEDGGWWTEPRPAGTRR